MTAVAPPRPPAPEPPAEPAPTSAPVPEVRQPSHLALAEVALTLLTAAAVYGFSRIFDSMSFLAPLLVVTAVAHGTALVCRRRRLGLLVALLATVVTWALTVTWLFFARTTWLLLPTTSTWRAANDAVRSSWTAFNQVTAPAPPQTGFLLVAAAAVALAAYLSDWAAFRLWSAREALVAPLTLFVFATLLAADRQRVASAVVFTAAALCFLVAHRVARLERADGWVTTERSRGARSLLRVGLGLVAVAVLLGALGGPRLPGAGQSGLVQWQRGAGSGSSRVIVSPLVDVQRRLVQQSNVVAFVVKSPRPAYWRLTALDSFDGQQWNASKSYASTSGNLDPAQRVSGTEVTQSFTLENLDSPWLPAAYQPTRLQNTDVKVKYDKTTSALLADSATANGATYDVTSEIPDLTADELRSASTDVPAEIRQTDLALPAGFSTEAQDLARQVTTAAGATDHYDEALALQDWFRTNFTYTLQPNLDGPGSPIDNFLRNKEGYCEQFAGTFAAMARSLGIPARVAVGFTWGEPSANDPTSYTVRGANAHAWPEVYLGQYGWVSFEPTPGRGAPGTSGYTGLDAAQATATGAAADQGASPTTETTATTAPADAAPAQTPDVVTRAPGSRGPAGRGVGAGLVVLAVAALLYVLIVPGGIAVRRRRRRRLADGSPTAAVAVAWDEVVEALALIGLAARPAETHAEVATRAAAARPELAAPLATLAGLADAAAYGPELVGAPDAAAAREAADAVEARVREVLGPLGRLRAALDPRRLVAHPAERRQAAVLTR